MNIIFGISQLAIAYYALMFITKMYENTYFSFEQVMFVSFASAIWGAMCMLGIKNILQSFKDIFDEMLKPRGVSIKNITKDRKGE